MDYLLAFKSFFGISPDDIGDRVVITNISPIYTGLIGSAMKCITTTSGFYENSKVFFCERKEIQVIKIPHGSCIVDVLKLLTRYVNEIIFIGIAGCITSRFRIGEICVPTRFVSLGNGSMGNCITICQTSGLIQTDEYYYSLKNNGIDLVDMECYDVYKLCQESGVNLKYIVQISDLPLELPFYSVLPQPINFNQIINLLKYE